MIEINGKRFCENCFEETETAVCKSCGYDPSEGALDQSLLNPGTVLLNRYVIGQIIGKGGFGITYLAYDGLAGRKIAVKEYFPYGLAQRTAGNSTVSVTSADSAETFRLGAEKFYNEAGLVRRFNGNPNIVGVFDCFYENGTVYIAMEYLKGQTLKEYIRDNGVLSPQKALFIANAVSNALVVAHSANVLHRDISADNIIICDNGDVKLIDFGAARQVVAEHSQSFSVIIKPGFAPPEQYSKKGNQGSWSDVYSLGTTLYFTLTGDIPQDPTARFDDDDTFKENQFDIDPALWEIITKATKLNISERYGDAYELKKALELLPIKPEPLVTPSDAPADTSQGAVVNITDMTVSIKPIRPKQSFFRRHLRTIIEAACGAAVIAVMIPLAIKAFQPVPAQPAANVDAAPNGETLTTSGGNERNLREEGYINPLFSVLSEEEQDLYSFIYYGINQNEKSIALPSATYTVAQVEEIYNDMMMENPHYNHVEGYNVSYTDSNVNREADPDEYVNAVLPIYNGIDPHEANDYITQDLRAAQTAGTDRENKIEFLRHVHDKLATETEVVARGSRPGSSTTHGAVIGHVADDLGLANTLCDYAQRMGFDSFVLDMYIGEDVKQALTRVKIDDTWYNIMIYLDILFSMEITEIPIAEGDSPHLLFLCEDHYIFNYSANPVLDLDEKYLPLLPTFGDMDPDEWNYYIIHHKQTNFTLDTVEDAYEGLLEETKTCLDNGEETVLLYIDTALVDGVWRMMMDSYISDIEEKYGITISGFTGEYANDAMNITLEM